MYEWIQKENRLPSPWPAFRPEVPEHAIEVYEIMRKCWSEVPAERPSFESLEEQFGSLISSQDQQMAERAIALERSVYAQVRRDLGPPQGYSQLRRDTRSQAP